MKKIEIALSIVAMLIICSTIAFGKMANPSNSPPDTPEITGGPQGGYLPQNRVLVNNNYVYTAETTDPDGDNFFFKWDWDDGTESDWIGPYTQGGTGNHSWSEAGIYYIRVKAKDDPNGDDDPSDGQESDWSEPYEVWVRNSLDLESQELKIQGSQQQSK